MGDSNRENKQEVRDEVTVLVTGYGVSIGFLHILSPIV
jgi:hypothetical protein